MSTGLLVVLVAGVAVLASAFARKQGYSNNQRIVLSGIALGLLAMSLLRDATPGRIVAMLVAAVVVVSALLYVRTTDKG